MKATQTLILIANGARAKFFAHTGPGKSLSILRQYTLHHDVRHARDIQSDRPGRTHDRSGAHRHAMEYPSDPQETEQTRFAKQIVQQTECALGDSGFDRLVITASPNMLALLRDTLTPAIRQRLYAEIDKDLTQIPEGDLAAHFGNVLNV